MRQAICWLAARKSTRRKPVVWLLGQLYGSDGRGFFRATSATVLGANLQGNDGQVIRISKAGSELGGMYAFSNEIALVSGNTGLYFDDANNKIFPLNGSGGVRDNITDLGASNARFKHGYFANTVYTASVAGITDNDTYINFANNNIMQFVIGGSERGRFTTSGFAVGKTSLGDVSAAGAEMNTVGYGMFSRSDNIALYANRGDTGTLVWFGRAGANKGDISVSSSAVALHLI